MGIIIGLLIRLITFPGVILDYFINKKTAEILYIEIVSDDFSKILSGESLEIKNPYK